MYVALAHARYHVERFWGSVPEGHALGLVSTLAVASDGAVVVAQRNGPPVLVFNVDGSLRHAWPEHLAADPHGVHVDTMDRVLLVDRDAHQVLIADLAGNIIMRLGERDRPRFQAPFNHPTSAAVASDGEIYVADGYGNSAVHRFAADGRHQQSWGRPGSGPGEFTTPHSVWLDRSNRVLVADRENDRVQLFGRDGEYLSSWQGFYHPMDICEDEHGFIYVTDQVPRMSQLEPSGKLVGRCRPVWNVPHGIACSCDGTFYVIEMNPSSLTRLVPVEPASEDTA